MTLNFFFFLHSFAFLGVNVYWQPKGYFDTATCQAYAKDFKKQAKRGQKLHQLDNLGGQSCPEFRAYMKDEADTLLHFTPPDCTDLAAAVDAGLGKDVKGIVKRKFEEDFDDRFDDWCNGKISASMSKTFLFIFKKIFLRCCTSRRTFASSINAISCVN